MDIYVLRGVPPLQPYPLTWPPASSRMLCACVRSRSTSSLCARPRSNSKYRTTRPRLRWRGTVSLELKESHDWSKQKRFSFVRACTTSLCENRPSLAARTRKRSMHTIAMTSERSVNRRRKTHRYRCIALNRAGMGLLSEDFRGTRNDSARNALRGILLVESDTIRLEGIAEKRNRNETHAPPR